MTIHFLLLFPVFTNIILRANLLIQSPPCCLVIGGKGEEQGALAMEVSQLRGEWQ